MRPSSEGGHDETCLRWEEILQWPTSAGHGARNGLWKSLHSAVPMLSAVLILACIAIAEIVVGISVLVLIFHSVQKTSGFSRRRRLAFVALGVLLISPALVPAGTLTVIPLPMGVLMAYAFI